MTKSKPQKAHTSPEMRALLRRLRKRAGLTQKELGDHLGMTPGAISAIEAGHRDTTLPVFQRWLDRADHKCVVHPKEQPVVSLSHLSADGERTVKMLIEVVDGLDPLLLRTLQQQIALWGGSGAGDKGSGQEDL